MAALDRDAPVTPKGRRTHAALLAAGATVVEESGLAGLSVAAVAARAGVAKGTFYVYFSDREAFIDALHQHFYTQVNEAIAAVAADLRPGSELLAAVIDAYLDVCLANRGVKALVLETRAQSELTTTMGEREELFAALARPSFKAIGVASPAVSARLLVALTSEAALIEMEAGHKVGAARDAVAVLARSTAA